MSTDDSTPMWRYENAANALWESAERGDKSHAGNERHVLADALRELSSLRQEIAANPSETLHLLRRFGR
jgi:hypothetical protein